MGTEWIEQENAANQRAAAEAEARAQRAIRASSQISQQGPQVFERFVRELKANTDGLSRLLGEELNGSTSAYGTTSCQVNVNWSNITYGPNIVSWNFHYSQQGIRFVIFGQKEQVFPFRENRNGEIGIGYGNEVLMPEKMGELTVRKMRELAKRRDA